MNEDLAYKITSNCTNVTATAALDSTLNVITCGQENKVFKEEQSLENTAE
jgi:hypothetical protein